MIKQYKLWKETIKAIDTKITAFAKEKDIWKSQEMKDGCDRIIEKYEKERARLKAMSIKERISFKG